MAKDYGKDHNYGKQAIKKGSDYGAHEAFQKADSPESVKDAAKGSTPYKHR